MQLIFEFHKSETTGFAGVLLCQAGDALDFAVSFEVLSDVIFSHIFLQATHKNFLHGLTGFGLSKLLSGSRSFSLHLSEEAEKANRLLIISVYTLISQLTALPSMVWGRAS